MIALERLALRKFVSVASYILFVLIMYHIQLTHNISWEEIVCSANYLPYGQVQKARIRGIGPRGAAYSTP